VSGGGRPLGWTEIETCLREVGEVLDEHGAGDRTIVVVGGAFAAWHQIRDATTDVDTMGTIDEKLRVAAEIVGARHNLELGWLNDRARPWQPVGFDLSTCTTVLRHAKLTVVVPPTNIVFLMKLNAARGPTDRQDMVALWPACTFATPQAAVDAFYVAYPMELVDEYLIDYVTDIANQADRQAN
jgi:hypothetical protein